MITAVFTIAILLAVLVPLFGTEGTATSPPNPDMDHSQNSLTVQNFDQIMNRRQLQQQQPNISPDGRYMWDYYSQRWVRNTQHDGPQGFIMGVVVTAILALLIMA